MFLNKVYDNTVYRNLPEVEEIGAEVNSLFKIM